MQQQGLQDLIMFRDELQQPEPTGMERLSLLQDMVGQDRIDRNMQYEMQPMMMDTGLMSLPVAQAFGGGFIKSITRPFKSIAKGLSKAVKGVTKGVRNVAKSPIGRIAIPLALGYFAGPLAGSLLGSTGLGAKALIVGGGTGLSSLIAGDDPEEAFKKGVISGGLYYGGGKLFGPKAGAGADKGIQTGQTTGAGTGGASSSYTGGPTDTTSLSYGQSYAQPTMVGDVAAQQAAGVGTSEIPGFTGDIGSATYGGVGEAQAASSALQGPGTIVSPESGISPFQDPGTMQYPGGTSPDVAGSINFLDKAQSALAKGVDLAKKNKLATALGVSSLLSAAGPQPVQQFTPDQLASAGITTDFDGQRVVYRNADGEEIDYRTALQMIQQASQSFGPGGERKASGVRLGYERVNDPVLSSSGGLIGMAYGGMPANDMSPNGLDVRYKEFSGMVGGQGGGMQDNVYMPIVERENGQQVATLAVSPKEYVVDANTMSLLGNGNPDEGAEIMDETVKDIRMAATGQKQQQKEIDGLAALDRMRRSV